jgi:hypothetical protein
LQSFQALVEHCSFVLPFAITRLCIRFYLQVFASSTAIVAMQICGFGQVISFANGIEVLI